MDHAPDISPLVSVIVPNFNHAPFLRKRIDSVLSQTFQDFELILLDDCSTDGSQDILMEYSTHKNVSHISINTENSGSTFTQWMKGLELARGEYVWIAESDDFCERTFLEELVVPLQHDTKIGISFCQSIVVTPDEEILYSTCGGSLSSKLPGREFIQRYMLGVNTILNASMVVFRKSLVSKVIVPYQEMRYCGDWFFWVNLCMEGDVFISGKYLNYFVRHPETVTSKAKRAGLDFFEGNRIFHFIMENVSVTASNKLKALEIRIGMFFKAQQSFLTKAIENDVIKDLLLLDPKMKSLIRRRRWVMRRHKLKKAIFRILKR